MPGSSWPWCSGSASRSDGSPRPLAARIPRNGRGSRSSRAAAPPRGKSSTKFKLSAQIQYCTTDPSPLHEPIHVFRLLWLAARPARGNEADVRFGSLADILTSPGHVRFTANNGSWAAPSAFQATRQCQWERSSEVMTAKRFCTKSHLLRSEGDFELLDQPAIRRLTSVVVHCSIIQVANIRVPTGATSSDACR